MQEQEQPGTASAAEAPPADPAAAQPLQRGVGKDPTVRTDFLPDRERERREEDLRHQLKTEFQLRQQVAPAGAKPAPGSRGQAGAL